MSKFQRPDFVSPATKVNLIKEMSNEIYALTDKLTQHYVNLYLIMNQEATISSQPNANNLRDTIIADCDEANKLICMYHLIYRKSGPDKINEIEALKNTKSILQDYFEQYVDYLTTHRNTTKISDQDPQNATDKAQPAIDNQKTVSANNKSSGTDIYIVDCQNCSSFLTSNSKEIKDLSFEDLTSYYFNQDLNAICRIEAEITGDIAQAS